MSEYREILKLRKLVKKLIEEKEKMRIQLNAELEHWKDRLENPQTGVSANSVMAKARARMHIKSIQTILESK